MMKKSHTTLAFGLTAKQTIDKDVCPSSTSEKNLRAMLMKTMSWRGFKKPDRSCSYTTKTSEHSDVTRKDLSITERELSTSSQLSMQRNAVFSIKKSDSYHSFLSEESYALEDEKGLEWGDEDPSSDEDNDDDDDDHSITYHSKLNDDGDDNDGVTNDSLNQSGNCSRSNRHLDRCEGRRRRRLSTGRSHGSSSALSLGSSICTYDESLDNISDSIEIGSSSRHSVGRSGRRRTTHNRHLHHQTKRPVNVSTASDPLSQYSCTSVLHKRLEINLKTHSHHSVSSARENPRYIVVKADPEDGVNTNNQDHALSTRKSDVPATPNVEHPRFIVIQSKDKDEEDDKDDKHHSRRGRRRRGQSVEKSTQSV
ncbi:hypothetical protein FisN_22Hu017 [Fistulifera solaris]|uniref:Uncharacterized protein n=1 Tax=Fistulifera solaris TaxID=1519565 RepID=A0A1Z5K304_FISSO|nr:hypothetical protein FisN_22Hu017 [Fistulifera solaris]|eukprot:GAX20451.1 hypothetical protein FisN_22Hu017 [Fistulifera solaris]